MMIINKNSNKMYSKAIEAIFQENFH